MRTLHALALAAAATFSFAAHAAPQNPDATVPVPGKAAGRYMIDSEDFKHYKGSYVLSNGKTLTMVNRGRTIYAEVDGKRHELVPVGYNVFVARNADMMLMFDEFYQGRSNDVLIKPRGTSLG